jgi:acyl-homoserine-lactone acylase
VKPILPMMRLLLAMLPAVGSAQAKGGSEILWDSWGVPHIYTEDREAALYAFGWAQMRAHGDAIARFYAAARGQASAHSGEDDYLDDVLVRQLGIPERARAALAQQEPRYRGYLEGFVRGQNDFAASHPDAVLPANRSVLPFTASDVLAHVLRVVLTRFLFVDRGAINDYADAPAAHRAAAPGHGLGSEPGSNGSNGYAIGPSRSASGHAMLVINPHLPWSGELAQFEAQITTGEHFIYGSALIGQPYIAMGFSELLGWTHTVNAFDSLDTYELTLRDEGYVWDGAVRPFETQEDATIEVRKDAGKRELRKVPRLSSVHGPVVWYDAAAGRALAVRFSAGGIDQLVRRYWQLADAPDVAAFEAAANRDRLGAFNTLYADRHGDILFRYEGVMPRRNAGDYAAWQGIQPGQSSVNLWRDDYDLSAMPRVHNPASGFIQNANDPPWYASLPPLDTRAFPPYIEPPLLDYRAQQSLRRVAADPSISFEELVALKQSNRVELADRFLPALLAAAQGRPELEAARRTLAAWDHTLAPDARGAVLFLGWADAMTALGGADWQAEPWSAREPLDTPRGLRSSELACRALRRASERVRRQYGRLQVSYGSVYRLRVGKRDLPASAGPTDYGVYSAAEFEPAGDGKLVASSGDSFVAVVEFGEPLRALGLLTYGNASQKGSPFVGDQLELFSRRELRPLWTTRAEVAEHLSAREVLGAPVEKSGEARHAR